ncbi:MAG: hypothetical protein JST19_19565 [Bacteroidetes bacterium]|nr:hypothetical protein [Bacteroidota bacterium]
MNINLIQGSYTTSEAIDLLHKLVNVKIKFHEDKINQSSNEEDIKMREHRIKALQHDLATVRHKIRTGQGKIEIKSIIDIQA